MNQYFPELLDELENLTDKRNQSYVTYQMKVIFLVRLLALICEIPHHDTTNNVFKKIEIKELEGIRKYIITKLIRNKMLAKYKIRDKYYLVVINGTGLATSRKISKNKKI